MTTPAPPTPPQLPAIPDDALNLASAEFWLWAAAIVVVTGLVGGLFTQGIKTNWLTPWAKAQGHKGKWWWKGMLWSLAVALGTILGAGAGGAIWQTGAGTGVGALCGCVGGLSSATIVGVWKRRLKSKLEEIGK